MPQNLYHFKANLQHLKRIDLKKGANVGLLQTELEESKQFDFETIEDAKDTCLVKLNRKNVALAEAMI